MTDFDITTIDLSDLLEAAKPYQEAEKKKAAKRSTKPNSRAVRPSYTDAERTSLKNAMAGIITSEATGVIEVIRRSKCECCGNTTEAVVSVQTLHPTECKKSDVKGFKTISVKRNDPEIKKFYESNEVTAQYVDETVAACEFCITGEQ